MKKFLPLIALLLLSFPAAAEDYEDGGDHRYVPAIAADAPTLRVGMDKSELVRLPEDAASIIVGNPVHASVLMDTPRLLVVVPKAPGATHFSVLNDQGAVILQRHVIVGAPQNDYIRVRKSMCGENAKDCASIETFYCPREGMCHEIVFTDEAGKSSSESGSASADKPGPSSDSSQ